MTRTYTRPSLSLYELTALMRLVGTGRPRVTDVAAVRTGGGWWITLTYDPGSRNP